MADLRVEQQVLTHAQGALRAAANRLAPVERAVKVLDVDAAGAVALAEALGAGNAQLAARVQATGKSLDRVAQFLADAGTAYGNTDQTLARAASQGG